MSGTVNTMLRSRQRRTDESVQRFSCLGASFGDWHISKGTWNPVGRDAVDRCLLGFLCTTYWRKKGFNVLCSFNA